MLSPRRAGRLARRCARRRVPTDLTQRGRARRAWRRLAAAARAGDPVAVAELCRIGQDFGHAHRVGAMVVVAERWVADRDPDHRALVLTSHVVAPSGLARMITLALQGHRSLGLEPGAADAVAALLVDPDHDVRAAAARLCAEASGPVLERLCELAGAEPAGPILPALLANPATPPEPALAAVLRAPPDTWHRMLTAVREHCPIPEDAGPACALALVALEPDPHRLAADPATATALVAAAARSGDQIATIARDKIAAADDQGLVDEVCEAAMSQPSLAVWCAERGWTPADPVRCAVFVLLTGSSPDYRAADPDWSLVALGYGAAGPARRAAIRAALPAGATGVVRRDARTGLDRTSLSDGEVGYLADQLAGGGDYPALWRLLRDVTLRQTLALADRLDGWAPADASRALFDRLGEYDPGPPQAGPSRLDIVVDGPVDSAAFTPDGSRLAIASGSWAGRDDAVTVYDLATGRSVEHHPMRTAQSSIAWTSDGVVIAQRPVRDAPCTLVHCSADGARALAHPGTVWALTSTPTGFAALTDDHLLLGSRSGEPTRAVPIERVEWSFRRGLAVDATTGNVAICGGRFELHDASGRLLSEANIRWPSGLHRATFAGSGTVLAGTDTRVTRWRLGGLSPVAVDTQPFPLSRLVTLAGSGLVVGLERSYRSDRALWVVDPQSFQIVDTPGYLSEARGTELWAPLSGALLAVATTSNRRAHPPREPSLVTVFDVAPEPDPLDQPMAEMHRADLGRVAALRRQCVGPRRRADLGLLTAFLASRFDAESPTGTW